ncbi:MAG TPA: efflux RND transporter periplasmic adaptor subunit [Acidobacteriaceae bacterium]|nr:efflux RND transporter periplasmic adaptor subunit [Terriglobia bacterium]HVC90213.1 efflux RND transporter periplasmic adaptor subunit [Acidobacteriaceae bacterium]
MDIARPDLKKRKFRRQVLWSAIGLVLLAAITLLVMRLKPAAPTVDRNTVWTDTVKRGNMIRQVRGLGTLVPREDRIRSIPAETEGTVVSIFKLPGALVHPDTVILRLTNPQLLQEAQDATLQLNEAQADYHNTQVSLESSLMDRRATAADIHAQYQQAQLQARTDQALYKLGVISGLSYSDSQGKADALTTREELQKQEISINQKALETQLAVQKAKVEQASALAQLKQREVDALNVRAGIEGQLIQMPLQMGQHVLAGTELAQIIQPNQLKAQLQIAETQAHDVQVGQPAEIDTHNGIVPGTVTRINPAVVNGTVTVDVQLDGPPPQGARPDLSVDGTVDLQRLNDVLYVGRPAFGNENSTISLFKLDPSGNYATRVPVKVGRASVNEIQILGGLKEGDTVILSDMSRWDNVDRIRLD